MSRSVRSCKWPSLAASRDAPNAPIDRLHDGFAHRKKRVARAHQHGSHGDRTHDVEPHGVGGHVPLRGFVQRPGGRGRSGSKNSSSGISIHHAMSPPDELIDDKVRPDDVPDARSSAGERLGVVHQTPPVCVTSPIGFLAKSKWCTTERGNARKPSVNSRKIWKPFRIFENLDDSRRSPWPRKCTWARRCPSRRPSRSPRWPCFRETAGRIPRTAAAAA